MDTYIFRVDNIFEVLKSDLPIFSNGSSENIFQPPEIFSRHFSPWTVVNNREREKERKKELVRKGGLVNEITINLPSTTTTGGCSLYCPPIIYAKRSTPKNNRGEEKRVSFSFFFNYWSSPTIDNFFFQSLLWFYPLRISIQRNNCIAKMMTRMATPSLRVRIFFPFFPACKQPITV